MAKAKRVTITYLLLGAIALLLLALLLIFPEPAAVQEGSKDTAATAEPEKAPVEEVEPRGSLYIVIDDVGNSMADLQPFLKLDAPLTFAVLPGRQYTLEAAEALHDAGHQVILHQPMEPEGDQDPGAGAIYSGMSKEEIYRILKQNLDENPYAVGMNNHMGSRASADEDVMSAVLQFAKDHKIYYLDSYTTGNSVSKTVAEKVRLEFTRRNSMFLDNERSRDSILEALLAGMETAEKRGHAVMIGHVMSNELADILMEMYPELLEEGYTFKELSEIFTENVTDAGSGY